MVIHVRTGKGGKERLTVLSSRLLEVLSAYWRLAKPSDSTLAISRPTAWSIYGAGDTVRDRGLHRGNPTRRRNALTRSEVQCSLSCMHG